MAQDETGMLRSWQRSAIGGRRSVIGGVVLALIAAFYVVGVPFLAENVEASIDTDESGRYVVDDYTTVVLPDGWSIEDQNDLLTTLTDGTNKFIVIASVPAEVSTPVEVLQSVYEAYSAESANVVTAMESFPTDAGGEAAGYRAVLAADPTGNGLASFAVIQNGRSFQPLFTGPPDLSDPFYDDAEAIVRSVEITAEPRDGGS